MPETAMSPEPMVRTQVLIPRPLKERAEDLARQEAVSFGEIVRRALDAYEPGMKKEDEALLMALAEGVVQSSQEAIAALELAQQEVLLTRRELEARRHGNR